jgi:quercetin dioxygenase-like cupin family protein
MNLGVFLIHSIDWPSIPKEAFAGDEGYATSQAYLVVDMRIRMIEYSPGYKTSHWCKKGHIILCMEGELEIELDDGKSYLVRKNMTIVLGEGETHRTYSMPGCRLFIVD